MPRRTQDSYSSFPGFVYGTFTLFGLPSQAVRLPFLFSSFCRSFYPSFLVWAPPLSLATTQGIDFSFFSSGYLDVSVLRVSLSVTIFFITGYQCFTIGGFPHSDTSGSLHTYCSPKRFAVCRVLLHLLVPRHPPCALFYLTTCLYVSFVIEIFSIFLLFSFRKKIIVFLRFHII